MNPLKKPLDLAQYEKYHIDQRYQAYVVSINSLTGDQCDDLEARYIEQGYKVFHVEMERNAIGAFSLKLVVAKMEMTF